MKKREFELFTAREEFCSRVFDEISHTMRGDFDRDRDRILYSKAFRRLSGKTQVFVAGNDDHIRTRLTHTLEVAQIATTISKYMGLDQTLTEAIALGHDIGHTPFGHVGERTLNYIMNGCYPIKNFNRDVKNEDKGFKHNWQSIRAVVSLEQLNRSYVGLNLTDYTLWGLLNHSSLKYKECKKISQKGTCNLRHSMNDCINSEKSKLSIEYYNRYEKFENLYNENSWTIEALIVSAADEIAQRHHDIEDGIEAKIIDVDELIEMFDSLFKQYFDESNIEMINYIREEKDKTYYLPALSKFIVNFLTTNLIMNTCSNLRMLMDELDIKSYNDFHRLKEDIKEKYGLKNIVCYSSEFLKQEEELQKNLRNRILNSHKAQSMDGKASYIIRQLFKAYVTNPQQLPDRTIITLFGYLLNQEEFEALQQRSKLGFVGTLRELLEEKHFNECDDDYKIQILRVICDYIAGMTDNFALKQYKLLYESAKVK